MSRLRHSYQDSGRGTPTSFRIKNFVDPLQPFLTFQGFVTLDGGLATELERNGANLKDSLWSAKVLLENPKLIQNVHEEYLRAGADIITTASYQASFEGFAAKGINEKEGKELFELSVRLAKQAVNNVWSTMKDEVDPSGNSISHTYKRMKPLIAGSLGPYGSYEGSEFVGKYNKSVQELMEFHRPRIRAVLAGEPDLLLLETIPCGNEEARAFEQLLSEEFTNVPTIMSFSCADGEKTNCGELFRDAVTVVSKIPNVVAIGINCTSPLNIASLLDSAKQETTKPFVVYPNRGEIYNTTLQEWQGSAVDFDVESWYDRGAKIVGGCCRTRPEDIKSIRDRLLATTQRK